MSEPTPPTPPTPPADPWYKGVDAEIVGHWDNKGWDKSKPETIALEASKQAREAQKHFGVPPDQLLKLPKDATDEAGWNTVHQRLGVPKEAKDYDFTGIKFGDKDLEPAFVDAMRGALLGARVSKDRAGDVVKAVVKYLSDAETAETTEATAKIAAQKESLKKNWGTNFDFNRLTAMQGAKRLGVSEETVAQLESIVGYDNIMEMFRKIGAGTSEDTFKGGTGGGNGNPTTLEGAQARKAELLADDAWQKRYLAGDVAAVREMAALNQQIAQAA